MDKAIASFVERLKKDIVLVAEGYIFELERRGYLKAGPYVPEVVLKHPDVVKELHSEFLRAGSEIAVACTYYGHQAKLKSIGREDIVAELNLKAVAMAREVAQETGALTAGNLSNTWQYDPNDPKNSGKVVQAIFEAQARWAVNGGADLIIAETFSHLGEARIALKVIKGVGLPAVVTFIPLREKSLDGYRWDEACKILEDEGAAVVGLNCGRGPTTMIPILERIRQKVSGYVAALPVPYLTTKEQPSFYDLRLPTHESAFPLALEPFQLNRFEMADFAVKARDMSINYIGICCGAGPHHVRAMAESLGRTVPASEYSPDLSLHPILGDPSRKQLFGAMKDYLPDLE
ncbi:MAG: homocysteine S-methyltransferase family protein [Syntrophobacterales bacterium]